MFAKCLRTLIFCNENLIEIDFFLTKKIILKLLFKCLQSVSAHEFFVTKFDIKSIFFLKKKQIF